MADRAIWPEVPATLTGGTMIAIRFTVLICTGIAAVSGVAAAETGDPLLAAARPRDKWFRRGQAVQPPAGCAVGELPFGPLMNAHQK